MSEQDKGHDELIADLEIIMAEARAFEFHGFKNEAYATPKSALADLLMKVAKNVIDGKYDN